MGLGRPWLGRMKALPLKEWVHELCADSHTTINQQFAQEKHNVDDIDVNVGNGNVCLQH
jgi:hypothetical protein